MLEITTKNQLYQQDFCNWITATVDSLKGRDFESLDLENLIEELEAMGRSEKREVFNRLVTIIEHILKLIYWKIEKVNNQRIRLVTINTKRRKLRQVLKQSPSLNNYLGDIYQECLLDAIKSFKIKTCIEVNLEDIEFDLGNILDENWLTSDLK